MVILARPIINDFARHYPLASSSLNRWYSKTENANWSQFTEVQLDFQTCDYIGNDRYVFDIAGNKYRLIAMIHFKRRTLYIRGIFTHAEYDEQIKKGTLDSL